MCEECVKQYNTMAPKMIEKIEEFNEEFQSMINRMGDIIGDAGLVDVYDMNGNTIDRNTLPPEALAEFKVGRNIATVAWLNGFMCVQTKNYENNIKLLEQFTEAGFSCGAAYAHHQQEIVKN